MKLRADTVIASFVVALFSSFLTALAVLLVKALAISVFNSMLIGDLILNVYILFFLSGVIFFRGSALAAWLLYRHDVVWGYKLEYRQVLPIFALSFIMALAVFGAVYYYIKSEYQLLAYLEAPQQALQRVRQF